MLIIIHRHNHNALGIFLQASRVTMSCFTQLQSAFFSQSLSLSLVGITTRLLYMLTEHLLLNIIVTFYIPGQL